MERTATGRFVETVDAREQQTLRWGFMRALFPSFAEEVELGRYLRRLLASREYSVVRLARHRQPDGSYSEHVFDVYACPA